jgi:hypothetical protein
VAASQQPAGWLIPIGRCGHGVVGETCPSTARCPVSREAIAVVHSRYEVRINARLSDRARGAFSAMHVTPVPAQTLLVGELALPSDLSDLLARCMAMGLEVVSLRQLPGNGATPGTPGIDVARRAPAVIRVIPPTGLPELNHRLRKRGPGNDPDHPTRR